MATRFPPNRDADLVPFTQNFATRTTATPTTYSLNAAQATAYSTLSAAFVSAYNVAIAKATRSPMNITLKDAAKKALLTELRMLARIVQNAPTTTNAMRDELNLPQRSGTSTPVGPPGTPNRIKATLASTGALTLTWKCDNPLRGAGTSYQVFRTIGTAAETFLGIAGEKKFVDATIPAGTAQITYQIQAFRSTAAGPWATFVVKFGAAGGVMNAVEEQPTLKRAA